MKKELLIEVLTAIGGIVLAFVIGLPLAYALFQYQHSTF